MIYSNRFSRVLVIGKTMMTMMAKQIYSDDAQKGGAG